MSTPIQRTRKALVSPYIVKMQAKGDNIPDGLYSYNLSIIRIRANTMAAKPHTPMTIESILSNMINTFNKIYKLNKQTHLEDLANLAYRLCVSTL